VTEKQRKLLTTALKIVVSAALLYFIFTKIDFRDVVSVLKTANLFWLFGALVLFVFSKILNALRLNLYFHSIQVPLTQTSNLSLYLLGMFYNLFLPGGIGGDAYKGYLIHKQFGSSTKKTVAVLLLDRLSGLLLICIYACLLAAVVPSIYLQPYRMLFLCSIPLGILVFWWMNKQLFPYTMPVFWSAVGYSALLQFTQILAMYCIIKSLGIQSDHVAYLLVFMVSSIVSVIPMTIGGIGSREITFLYGAAWLGLDANTAVGISFVFFLITALVSFFGVYYHFKKPKLVSVSGE